MAWCKDVAPHHCKTRKPFLPLLFLLLLLLVLSPSFLLNIAIKEWNPPLFKVIYRRNTMDRAPGNFAIKHQWG